MINSKIIKQNTADGNMPKAKTKDELEALVHRAIADFKPELNVCVPYDTDVSDFFGMFVVTFGTFYSNLTDISCTTSSYPGSAYKTVGLKFTYRIGRVKLKMMENAVKAKIAEISPKLFVKGMKSETKAYVAHSYLVKTVSYWDKEEPNALEMSYMQSAYGALINGKCVCQGYAEAYKRLLNSQGICCEVVCGKIRGSSVDHAWNAVSFDGKNYYHIDVTWDDSADSFDYYGLTDGKIAKNRIWTRPMGIVCNGGEDILGIAKKDIALKKYEYIAGGADKRYLV